MSTPHRPDIPDLDELLAGRALGDLTTDESAQLNAIFAQTPARDTDDFERVAAALVAGIPVSEELPAKLRSKVRQDAGIYVVNAQPTASRRSRISTRESVAWIVAIACLVLAMIQWWPSQQPTRSPVEQRADLLARGAGVLQVAWSAGLHPFQSSVEGDVVWSVSQQRGFMRFANMPINDPSVEQYQLWIIDPSRDDEPIDGGVFDVAATGEVVIPIDAKLNVISPQAFAVTIEKPGGVVVSTQERLPLLAKVDA